MTLFRQQFRAMFMGLVIWCAVSFMLAWATVATVPGMQQGGDTANIIAALPQSIQTMYGVTPGLAPVDSLLAMGITKSMIIVVIFYAVLLSVSAVTREVDRRTIDFLLSLPVQRTEILWSRVLVLATNTGLQAAVMWATLCVGLHRYGLPTAWGRYGLVLFNIWLLGMAIGGVTLLASLWIDDYSRGVKLFLGITAGFWIMEYGLRMASVSRWGRFYSPFSYVNPGNILKNGTPWVDLAVLALLAAASIWLSFPAFQRKQISA